MMLDCVVVGYNEGDFDQYRLLCEGSGSGSPDLQIFSKEHLVLDGHAMPWLEAFSMLRRRTTGRPDRYHPGEVFNLAGIYLSSYLRRHGFTAEPISLFGGDLDELRTLLEEGPRLVAITTTFYVNALPVLPVVEFVREHAPASRIVVGGPLVDNLCQDAGVTPGPVPEELGELLGAMGADYYVWESQGESTLARLCMRLRQGADPSGLPNLVVERGERWVANPKEPESNDLDEGSIRWTGFTPHQLGVTAQMRTARSCAFKCSFCDYPMRAGKLATASVETVRRELRELAALGVRNVVFVDDTFNVPVKRFKEICTMLAEEQLDLSWYSYFRCSNARDDETFDLAAESGCAGVFLGVESADNGVLENMRKLAQDSQYRDGILKFEERGITTFAAIIVGFPGETERSIETTVEFLNELQPSFWRAQPWWGNPRSPIYLDRERFGIEGERYDWRHDTMTSEDAARYCDVMFDAVTGSTWLPLYDFDFWSLPYLAGKGVSAPELKEALAASQEVMSLRDRGLPTDAAQERFERLVAALDVEPAKYRLEPTPVAAVR